MLHKNIYTIEPHYISNIVAKFKVPVISNIGRIPLDLTLCFQLFTISYFLLGYFKFPAISNCSFFP